MKAVLSNFPGAARRWELADVVQALTSARTDGVPGWERARAQRALPSREVLEEMIADLRAVLFPIHFGGAALSDDGLRYYVGHHLDGAVRALHEQVQRALLFACTHRDSECHLCMRRAEDVASEFAVRLPALRTLLESDVRAAYEGDPAATSPDEALFCYPGLTAITHHRIAHEIYELGVPLIARVVSELAHAATGIDVHPGAQIGGSFFIDHGTGVVIGETTVIGERVRLYQGVTLGARSFPTDERGRPIKGIPRHPIVEDDVAIYAGATILGRVTIGKGSRIGGNVWLTHDVPPGSRVSQAQLKQDLFDGGSGI